MYGLVSDKQSPNDKNDGNLQKDPENYLHIINFITFQCYSRIDQALKMLSDPLTVDGWVFQLKGWIFKCDEFESDDACTTYVRSSLTKVLTNIVDSHQSSYAKAFCVHWGSCSVKQADLLP